MYWGGNIPPPRKQLWDVYIYLEATSSTAILVAGRTIIPCWVLIVADRTWPSLAVTTSVIRPLGQRFLGRFSSTTITTSPTARGCRLGNHLDRLVIIGMYSFTHLLQKRSASSFAWRQRCLGLDSLVSGGLKPSADPSNKWLGVSASSSSASKETKVSGREFITYSALIRAFLRLSSL